MAVGTAVMAVQKGKPMSSPVMMFLIACMKIGLNIVKDKPRRTDQMSGGAVINLTVIQKMMKKSAPGIEDVRVIEIKD